MEAKLMTLCCIYNEKQILLGQIKKAGVLKNRYNGFGGKVEPGETIETAAKRELLEEAAIVPLDFQQRGKIICSFDTDNPFEGNPLVEFHIFSATKFDGTPMETEEMLPRWFEHTNIPYDNMWPDDKFWLPLLLEGKNFTGELFLKNPNEIREFKLDVVENI